MKTLHFIMILLTILCVQCSTPASHKKETTGFFMKENIASVADSFLSLYPNKKVYELFINKEGPHEFVLILHAGDTPLTKEENKDYKQNPIIQVARGKVLIDVYSGIERYIGTDQSKIYQQKLNNVDEGKFWIITDSFDIIKVDTTYKTAYPFIALPHKLGDIKFTTP